MAIGSFIDQPPMGQSRIQSFALVISVSLCFLIFTGFAFSSLLASAQSDELELDEKINPNDAPLASLVRLPGIGIARAEAIIAYRESVGLSNGSAPAFQDCDDLQKVAGIGPKTAQSVSDWLDFE